MKKLIIGSLVGALLLFGWQAIAHMFMHHHDVAYKQVPNEAAVLTALSSSIQQEGQYMVPGMDMNATQEEMQKADEAMRGKPWALITYHPVYESDMAVSSIRSFVTALLCVMIFVGLIGIHQRSFVGVFLKALGLGFLTWMLVWYNQNIWMQTPWDVIKGEGIDLLAGWALVGLWLGWYLTRPTHVTIKRFG